MADTTSVWERVRGVVPVSLCDWPGKITCVLFTAGCNLRCPTCHNASLAWHWHDLPTLDRNTIVDDLHRRVRWLDGITVSGGEPTHLPGLVDLVADLATVGLPIKVDSNGSDPDMLDRLLRSGLARTVAVDVKGPWELYPELTGQALSASDAKRCLERVFDLAREFPGQVLFRCTKVPLLTDKDLESTRKQVPDGQPFVFQDFVPPRSEK